MTTFTDDFNRSNGAPGATWVDGTGLWTIVSNQLSSGSAGGTIVIRAATAMATSDHSAQVTVAATAAVSHGVWCRGNTGFTSGYLFRNDGTSWVLFSVVGGSFTSIASYTAAAVSGDVVKIQAVGSAIKCYVNGTLRVSVTDTAVTTGTSVGLRAESTSALRFDDFTATDITSGVTGDTALAGTASLSASGSLGTGGAASLAATASLTASGQRTTAGNSALAATAGLTADGVRGTSGAALLAVTASLSADGVVVPARSGDAALTATASLTAAGSAGRRLDASLTGTATLVAAGAVGSASGANLAVTATLHASGQVASAIVRGSARQAAAAQPGARRGETAGPRAQRGEPTTPTARGGGQ